MIIFLNKKFPSGLRVPAYKVVPVYNNSETSLQNCWQVKNIQRDVNYLGTS